jgi:DNA ligase (NAD+)
LIEGLDGFGEKSADNILESIESSRRVPLHRFLFALGIRHVGEQTAKDIAKKFFTIDTLISAAYESLCEVEGVGDKVAEELVKYFSNKRNKEMLSRLLREVTIYNEVTATASTLQGQSVVITGTLPTLSREEAKSLIESHGGKVSSSVSSKTSFILLGDNPGSKYDDAKNLGIPMLSEDEFLKRLKK